MPQFDPSQPYEDIGLEPQFDPSKPYEDLGVEQSAPTASQPKRRSLLRQLGSGVSRAAFGEDITEEEPQVAAIRQQFEALKIPSDLKPKRLEDGQMTVPNRTKLEEFNHAVDLARDNAIKEQFGIEPISPVKDIGQKLAKWGKYSKAALADLRDLVLAEFGVGDLGESVEPENLMAAAQGDMLPVERDIQALPKAGRVAAGVAFGAAEMAPQLAASAALRRIGVPVPVATGAPFAFTPEGFNVEEGIKMGLFPSVSKAGEKAAEIAVSKLGINLGSEAALGAVKALGATSLALGYVHATSLPAYAKMTPEQREEAILSNTGMILAFEAPKFLGVLKEKGIEDKVNAAIMRQLEEKGNLIAALELGKQTIPGAEKILPQLPGEKRNIQPPVAGAQPKETNASTIRSDQTKLPESGQVVEESQKFGGNDVQLTPSVEPEPVAPREEAKAPEGDVVAPVEEPKAPPAPAESPEPPAYTQLLQELGRTIVQGNLKAGRAKLQRVTDDPEFNRGIGVVPGTGRIRVNAEILARDTAGLTPEQRAEYLRRAVNEELIHNAGGLSLYDEWNQIPKNERGTFAEYFDAYHRRLFAELTPEQIAETVRRYGKDIADNPVHVAAEFIRMKVQDAMEGKRTEEPLTAGMVSHFKALLRRLQVWVKEISGNKQLATLAREHIKAIKELLRDVEEPVEKKARAVKANKGGIERPYDLIDAIQGEVGKIRSHTAAKPGTEGYYSEVYHELRKVPALRRLFDEHGQAPDDAIETLRRVGFMGENASVEDLWDALLKVGGQRRAFSRGELPEQKEQKFMDALARQEKKKGAQKIAVGDLTIGDEFIMAGEEFRVIGIDPDTGEVTVGDGRKFGTQAIPDGVSLSVEPGSLKTSGAADFDPDAIGAARRKRDEGPLLPGMEPKPKKSFEEHIAEVRAIMADKKKRVDDFKAQHGEATFEAPAMPNQPSRNVRIIVSKDIPTGRWRYTVLDDNGPSSHSVRDTWEQAVAEAQADYGMDLSKARIAKSVTPEPAVAPPKLRSMEKQGDLLSTQTEDFALTGEKGVDVERLQRERAAKEAKRKAGEEGTGELTLGAARRREEVPYGFWISPDGKMTTVPTMSHKAEAKRILSEIGAPFDPAKGVTEDQLQARGYARATFEQGANTLIVDHPNQLNRAQRQAVKDYAIEKDINALYVKNTLGSPHLWARDVIHEASGDPFQTFGAAKPEGKEEEPEPPSIEVHGIKHRVRATAKLDAVAGTSDAMRLFTEAGFQPVVREDGNIGLIDEAWPGQNLEGQKLLQTARNAANVMLDMAKRDAPPNDLLARFLDSTRSMALRMISERRAGNPTAIDDIGLLNDLVQAGHQPVRQAAQLVQAMNLRTRDFVTRMQHVDAELLGVLSEAYGGNIVRKVLHRVVREYQDYFTPEEIATILNSNPELQQLLNTLMERAKIERGTRVYRMAQQRLKPKVAATIKALESRAIDQEAVQQIIENAKALGVPEPPSKTKALTPLQKLLLMVQPETQARIDDSIAKAVRQGERNAAREIIVRDKALADDELALYDERTIDEDAVGPDPTDEQVEAGLKNPKFTHWGKLRDGLLGYSPTTMKLAQDIVKGEFRGTQFGEKANRPLDLRIDLAALAKAPEVEVQRVLDALGERVEALSEDGGPAVAERVREMIVAQAEAQIALARQRFLNNFFDPKERGTSTASQRLQSLINAGVTRDPRFQTERVRGLVKKVTAAHLDADQLESLATSTRAEKGQWLDQETMRIMREERLAGPGDDAAYFEAVIRTQLAERLQAAEERIVRSFLTGADAQFERKPVSAEERARTLDEAKGKLEGIIRAGGIDTPMVEQVSRKHLVQKFVPRMGELVQKVFETQAMRRSELGERFADSLVEQLGIDPALADKAKAVFEAAFGEKMRAAEGRALAKVQEDFTPEEWSAAKPGKKLWKRLIEGVNAGLFDDFELVTRIAGTDGYKLNPGDIAKMKELAAREQTLRELTPGQRKALDIDGITAERIARYDTTKEGLSEAEASQLETARATAFGSFKSERDAIHHQMVTIWARMTNPVGLSTQLGRRNMFRAVNEFVPANLLFRIPFATVQSIDILTQSLSHHFTTAAAHAGKRVAELRSQEEVASWMQEFGIALRDSVKLQLKALPAGLQAARLALRTGRGSPQRIEGIETSMHVIERMVAKADALMEKGDPASIAAAFPLWLASKVGLAYRVAGSLDVFQSSQGRFPELQAMVKTALIETSDLTRAEIEMAVPSIVGDINAEIALATSQAPELLAEMGIKETPAELKTAAWNIVYSRMLERVRRAGLPDKQLQEAIDNRMQTLGWNRPEKSWIGAPARLAHGLQEAATKVYFPTGPLTAFANAAATAMVQKLEYTPLGFVPDVFKGSPTTETDLDQRQVRAKAAVGTAVGVPLLMLAAVGGIKVLLKWPDDPKEREKWQALGLKPGMALLPVGAGQTLSISLTAGPLALVSPYLAVGGSLYDARMKKEREQQKLNAEALKKGLPPGEVPGLGVRDIFSAGLEGAWNSIQGTRTASGKIGHYSEMGQFLSNKAISSYLSAFVPFLPFYQSTTQLAGLDIDARKASISQIMVPTLNSGARRVNALGDPVTEYGDLQNLVTRLTRGSGALIDENHLKELGAYSALFASGFTPPPIQPNKGYEINGQFRPLNQAELADYAQRRGQYLKQELSGLGPNPDASAVRTAYQSANVRALSELGVTVTQPSGGSQASGSGAASSGRLSRPVGLRRSAGVRAPAIGRRPTGISRSVGRGTGLRRPRARVGRGLRRTGLRRGRVLRLRV